MTNKFIDSPLGSSWQDSIVEGINYSSLAIERFGKLKATKFDNSFLPEWVQQVENFIDSLPFVVSMHDLAQFFYVEASESRIQLGQLTKGKLENTLVQIENLPQIYFEDQNEPPPPLPDPSLSICDRLVNALENLNFLSAAEVRMIIKEELTPLFSSVLNQGHATRVELLEVRNESEQIWNAVHTRDSTRENPISSLDIINDLINSTRTELLEVRNESEQIWNAVHTRDSTRENPIASLDHYFSFTDFPKTLPASLIQKYNDRNQPIAIPTKTVNSWLELVEWLFRVFEELIGEFPLGLEIVTDKQEKPVLDGDGNPVLDGDGNPQTEVEIQKEVVRLPNISECLAEVYLLNHQSYLNSEVNLELMVKQISSLVVCQKVAIQNAYKLQALEDYLGCDFEIEVVDMPMPFTVGAQSISVIKKPKTTKIEVAKYNQKRNFQDALAQLLHSAGVIKSLFWRSLPKDAESAASAFKGIIENQKATRDIIEKLDQDNLDIDLEKIEQGFTSEAGISDSTPYGLPLEQRPRIKQIGRQDAEGQ